ncbi:MAG: hypothetical protein JXR88_01440 [Clostridia bacterium]|nr:hypothetical protein [Clostridia bacterium]
MDGNLLLDLYLEEIKTDREHMSIENMEMFLNLTELTRNELIEIFKSLKTINQEVYVYGLTLLGSFGVLESIYHKAKAVSSVSLPEFEYPVEGTPMKALPKYADKMTRFLKEHVKEQTFQVLADNHHGIPDEAFDQEVQQYIASTSLEDYLKERHDRKVQELQQHADENKIWFEQVITQEVVDFVKANQEMLSAVLKDEALYITKIPYDTVSYLHEKDNQLKRHAYCHCGLARAAILTGEKVDPDWCYCSAGFAKKPFEMILGRPLKITVLNSVLKGDMTCRFKIDL